MIWIGDDKHFSFKFKHFKKAKEQLQRKNEQTNIAKEDQKCRGKKIKLCKRNENLSIDITANGTWQMSSILSGN